MVLWTTETSEESLYSYDITADNDGNFIVWGRNGANLLMRVGPDGMVLWQMAEKVDELLVDSESNVIYTSNPESYGEDSLVKRNANGDLVWKKTPAGLQPWPLRLDSDNNIYLLERDDSNSLSSIVKYAPDGEELLRIVEDEQIQGYNLDIWDIDCTSEGIVYADGYLLNDENLTAFVERYGSDGTKSWLVQSIDVWDDFFLAEARGDLFWVTRSYEPDPNTGFTVTKLNAEGDVLWSYAGTWDERPHNFDWIPDFQVDDEGNAILLGSVDCVDYSSHCSRLALAKLDSDGNLLWNIRRDDIDAEGMSLAIDSRQNIIVTGDECLLEDVVDCAQSVGLTVKFDANGEMVWTEKYVSPNGHSVTLDGMALDSEDNVYVSGGFRSDSPDDDSFVDDDTTPDDDSTPDDDGSSDDDSSTACGC
jgi:hypothetical protein